MATTIDRAGVESLARKLNEIGLEVALWAINAPVEQDRKNLTQVAQSVSRLRDELLEVGRKASARERMT